MNSENLVATNEVVVPSVDASGATTEQSTYYIVMGVFRGEISATKLIESLKRRDLIMQNGWSVPIVMMFMVHLLLLRRRLRLI